MLFLLASMALAQDIDGHGFSLNPSVASNSEGLTTWRAQSFTQGQASVVGLFEYAKAPLVRVREFDSGAVEREALLDNVVALNLGGTVGLHERVGLSLFLPIYGTSSGLGGAAGPAFGDPRLSVPVSLLADDLSLSVVPWIDLPLGAGARYLGDARVGGGGMVAGRYAIEGFDFAANLGAEASGAAELVNLGGGARLLASLGVSYAVLDDLSVQVEGQMRPTFSSNEVRGTDTPAEVIGSARGTPGESGLSVMGGVAAGLSRGATAARFRVFAGVGMSFGGPEEEIAPEVFGAVRLKVVDPDGAPVEGAQVVIDGVTHSTNEEGRFLTPDLPLEKALMVSATPPEGAPLLGASPQQVQVAQGVQDVELTLPWQPGRIRVTVTVEGEPIPASVFLQGEEEELESLDVDGEALVDLQPGEWSVIVAADAFGTQSRTVDVPPGRESPVEVRFELESAAVEVTREEVVALTEILFAYNSAEILEDSLKILDEVAANLLAVSDIAKVEIQGHTDDKGDEGYNQKLSQERVDAVVEYLEGRGVDRYRLESKGYGETCPLEDNSTKEGRAANRRVQFIILDPAPSGEIPCHDGAPARRVDPRTFELEDQEGEEPTEE